MTEDKKGRSQEQIPSPKYPFTQSLTFALHHHVPFFSLHSPTRQTEPRLASRGLCARPCLAPYKMCSRWRAFLARSFSQPPLPSVCRSPIIPAAAILPPCSVTMGDLSESGRGWPLQTVRGLHLPIWAPVVAANAVLEWTWSMPAPCLEHTRHLFRGRR